MNRIHLELDDLQQAAARLDAMIRKLREDQRYVQQQTEWVTDNWKGASAEALQKRLHAFFSELAGRIRRLEERKQELTAYVRMMRQADRELSS